MNKRIDDLTRKIKTELGLFLSISFGVFLFVLFFQPFPPDNFNFNNHLVFVAGLGGIIFLTLVLVRTTLPWLIKDNAEEPIKSEKLPPYMKGLLIFLISSVAFEFYLRYVGSVKINFFISTKVILTCLAPPLILNFYDTILGFRKQNNLLIQEKKEIQKQIEKYEEDYLNKTVSFISENSNENLSLPIAEVAFIRSADNYVEIVYKESENFKKRLIRSTLKNIEMQIKQYSNFLRCHRICIVNVHFIEKLSKKNESYWLSIKGIDEQIPVSRQYLLKLKESL